MTSPPSRSLSTRPSRRRTGTPLEISASILEMTAHPVLALRSAGSGNPIACSARTTHRGHPLWRLVHQLCSTQLHQTTQLPALSSELATSVSRRVTILVSVPIISTKFRMLHHVPEVTTTTTTTVASHPRRFSPPTPHLPPLVDV